jgi:hypothetical protein
LPPESKRRRSVRPDACELRQAGRDVLGIEIEALGEITDGAIGWIARRPMMLASASRCRLRAAARLALARRAVDRRIDRAGAAAGLDSETWVRTWTCAMVPSSVRHVRRQHLMLGSRLDQDVRLPTRGRRTESEGLDPECSPGGQGLTRPKPARTPTGGTASPAVKTASRRLPPRDAQSAVGGIRAEVVISGRRASNSIDTTPI